MLETDEGQVNAVFACFGSAAQHAQHFEKALIDFLKVYNELANKNISLESLLTQLKKKTMGALLKEFNRFVRIDQPSVPQLMNTALTMRNFLIHKFFLEREHLLDTKDNRFKLLQELVQMESVFQATTKLMNGMRIAMLTRNESNREDHQGETLFTIEIDIPDELINPVEKRL